MEFVNKTGFDAGWTTGLDRDGRELLVVAIKATYLLPPLGEEPVLAEEQLKLVKADEFNGEPGRSAPVRETDYAHRKPKCDVILNGCAYAPTGRAATSVRVSLRVGEMKKSLFVFGERRWVGMTFSPSASEPEPFTQSAFSYETAYGGTDFNEDEPEKVATYVENPVGIGYHPVRRRSELFGRLLPNTSETRSPITDSNGHYRPMSLGPVGRTFFPRYRYAGTYDKNWLDNEAPCWPKDFSYAYFQSAAADQQVDYLRGGEEVELTNLTPDGHRSFRIPRRSIPVTCIPSKGDDVEVLASCDTFLLEPDLSRFSLTWRAAIPLRRNIFELKQAIVGELPTSWYSKRRAQRAGKVYYASLAEAVAARSGRKVAP